MVKNKILKFLLILNGLMLLNAKSLEIKTEDSRLLIDGETTGSCSNQLSLNLQERNCRYGRCEQTKNGTDYVCHCDNFITGDKCDRLVVDLSDGCASNPCWGESLCITLEDTNSYKCLCPESRTGVYCQSLIKNLDDKNNEIESDYSEESEIENLTSLLTSLTSLFTLSSDLTTTTPSLKLNSSANIQLIKTTTRFLSTKITENLANTTSVIIPNVTNTTTTIRPKTKLSSIFLNTFIPKPDVQPECNYETCQLGKCLSNGTCECLKPAFGKFCDQIDECLSLSCKHGKCENGKGCMCEKGYEGPLCERLINRTTTTTTTTTFKTTTIPIKTTTNTIASTEATTTTTTITTPVSPTSKISARLIPTPTNRINSTKSLHEPKRNLTTQPTTLIKSEFLITPSFLKKNTTNFETTTQFITNCENGGLLIDNVCICLNQFTGLRCEVPPTFSDSSIYNLQTKAPELESIEPITPKLFSIPSSPKSEKSEVKEDEELIPIFTISRFNTKTKNISSQRSIYWPWFECFPGDSKVYWINKTSGAVEQKYISNLNVDDEILVVDNYQKVVNFSDNQFKFSRVVTFLHKIENLDAKFLRIFYQINNETSHITLTPRHLIYVKSHKKPNFEFMSAYEVQLGDWLKYYDYDQKVHKIVNVTKIETVNLYKTGIYAPLTETGTLVVDNLLASCYSMVKNHKTAQFFFNILNRLNYFIKLTSDSYVTYSKFLYETLNFLQLSNLFLNVNL